MKVSKSVGDFIWFAFTVFFVLNLISEDFWDILDWSTPGAVGSAVFQALCLFGLVMFVKEVLIPALKKRKEK